MGSANLIAWGAKLLFQYDYHFKYANWNYWFRIQRKRMSTINTSIPKSNFEGNINNYEFSNFLFLAFSRAA